MPKAKYETAGVSFPDETILRRAKERAKRMGLSFSRYVTILIERDLDETVSPMSVRDLVRPISSQEHQRTTLPPIDPDTEHGREILAKAGIVAAGLTPSGGFPPPPKAASTSDNKDVRSFQSGRASSPESDAPARARVSRVDAKRKTAP